MGEAVDFLMAAALMLGGAITGAAVVANAGYAERHFNRGLATAVACAPGTYLQDLDDGLVLCIGGNGETWRERP